ncbi:hypothetical protein [Paraliomyxa miuraensis]|uniref:hypothetical protein n=1 Tax=Paraliomyxa miuraensis TaxID=376150 RepID=UPI002259FB8B|nr:hypothetical protein [Paraliomyxa miuraensis]MCX4240826.1 hypothetical protein [Paraliomyxa miuraensis]
MWNAESLEEREEIFREWWAAVGSPSFLPLEQISQELSADRRWRRVHAARHLRELGGPDLIDRELAFASDDLAAANRCGWGDCEAVAAAQRSLVASADEADSIAGIVAGLTHARRWRRWGAAQRLLDSGGPALVDPTTGDVAPDAVAAWMSLYARGPLHVA